MRRRLPRIRTRFTLWILLLAGLAILWTRSRRHADVLAFYTPQAHLVGVASEPSGLLLCATDLPFDPGYAITADWVAVPTAEFIPAIHEVLFDPSAEKWHALGFRSAGGTLGTAGWSYRALVAPYWAVAVVLAMTLLPCFNRWHTRRRRKKEGRCLACGYDLRSATERCPECGRPITANAAKPWEISASRLPRLSAFGVMSGLVLIAVLGGICVLLMRGRAAINREATMPADMALAQRHFSEVRVRGRRLDDFIVSLAQRAGATADIDWQGLGIGEAERAAPINLDLRDVTFGAVLNAVREDRLVSSQISFEPAKVRIGTDGPLVVRSYPVGDLLKIESSATFPPKDNGAQSNVMYLGGNSGGNTPASRLYGLIINTCMTDTWRDNGGSVANPQILGDRMWVLQTQQGHQAIRALLDQLRNAVRPDNSSSPPAPSSLVDLNQRIGELKLDSVPLGEALDHVRQATHCNLFVCWLSLEAAGFGPEKRVSVHLWDVRLEDALSAILQDAASEKTVSVVQDGIILVGTGDVLLRQLSIMRVYDVHDLIAELCKTLPPARPLAPLTSGAIDYTPDELDYDPRREATETIVHVLEGIVDTDTWRDNGGGIGAISAFNGLLVITQTPENQQRVVELFRKLRSRLHDSAGPGLHRDH